MEELERVIKWIDDYESDYFGTAPHANLIRQIIKCRVSEIKEDVSKNITISKKEYELLKKDSYTLWNCVGQ